MGSGFTRLALCLGVLISSSMLDVYAQSCSDPIPQPSPHSGTVTGTGSCISNTNPPHGWVTHLKCYQAELAARGDCDLFSAGLSNGECTQGCIASGLVTEDIDCEDTLRKQDDGTMVWSHKVTCTYQCKKHCSRRLVLEANGFQRVD